MRVELTHTTAIEENLSSVSPCAFDGPTYSATDAEQAHSDVKPTYPRRRG